MHLLYVTLSEKEKRLGFDWLALLIASVLLHPIRSTAVMEFVFQAGNFAAAVLIFHTFLRTSLQVPLTTPFQILKMAILGLILAQLANLLTNDLLYYFFPQYFYYDETGPHFGNVLKFLMETFAQENFPLTAIAIIFFVPIWEEVFHRGLVFGSLLRKNLALAYMVSAALYAFAPIVPLFGNYPLGYIVISFLQYIPIGVLFAWVYTRTETILTPILAHMVMNAVSIFTMR